MMRSTQPPLHHVTTGRVRVAEANGWLVVWRASGHGRRGIGVQLGMGIVGLLQQVVAPTVLPTFKQLEEGAQTARWHATPGRGRLVQHSGQAARHE